jgi:hypothetical protein
MREVLLICMATASAFPQAGSLRAFTNSGDVGGPAIKGAAQFDASKRKYGITGAGSNMWGSGANLG